MSGNGGVPATSRAAVVRRFGDPVVVEPVKVPAEIEAGALLVRIEACSLCGTDIHLARGELAMTVNLPVILGHEMVGRIVEMGAGGDRDSIGTPLKLGDRVVWSHASCGACFYCTVERMPALCTSRRSYMFESIEQFPHLMGGITQYAYVLPRSGRVRVPDEVSDELASICSCAYRTVMNATAQLGGVRADETVVVQGAGPLGIYATGVLKLGGAKRVITLGAPAARLDLAKAFGADLVLNVEKTSAEERHAAILDQTGGRGADVVFELSGVPQAFAEGVAFARKNARYVVVGQLGTGKTTIQPALMVTKNMRVVGVFSGDIGHYWQALEFVRAHRHELPFDRMVTGRYELDEINTAIERMQSFAEIKPIIYPNSKLVKP